MAVRAVPRATEPHLPSLVTALAPLLAAANAGAFEVRWSAGIVRIEQASFAGVDVVAVDAAVLAAPPATAQATAKSEVDSWPLALLAGFDAVRDAINVERARHGAAAFTRQQFMDSIKAKVDNWT